MERKYPNELGKWCYRDRDRDRVERERERELYFLEIWKDQALFQTNQSISQSFGGLCWVFPRASPFPRSSGGSVSLTQSDLFPGQAPPLVVTILAPTGHTQQRNFPFIVYSSPTPITWVSIPAVPQEIRKLVLPTNTGD